MEKQTGNLTDALSLPNVADPGPALNTSKGATKTVSSVALQVVCQESATLKTPEKLKDKSKIESIEKGKDVAGTIPRKSSSLMSKCKQEHASQAQAQALISGSSETSTSSEEICEKPEARSDSLGSQGPSKPGTVSEVWKYMCRSAGRLNNVFFATASFIVTSYCAVTAPLVHSPLGLFSPTHGVLVLHILARVSDIGLGLAVGSMWESVQWGSVFAGLSVPVPVFFALDRSTGFLGLVRLLISKARLGHRSRLWSLARLIVYIMIPGPGIILMSDLKIVNLDFPSKWSNITGGIGVFNASLIEDFTVPGPRISGLAQYLLTDTTTTFQMHPPINDSCGLSSSACISFLLLGGIGIISPWHFGIAPGEPSNYMIKNGPAYQLDFGQARAGASWPSDACKLYRSEKYGFQLCIEADQNTNQLIAGWRTCSTSEAGYRLCNQTWTQDVNNTWLTSMATYRRMATVTASRSSWDILDVTDLSTPVAQNIRPADLFSIMDIIVTPAQDLIADRNSSDYWLSDYLFQYLEHASDPSAQAMSRPLLFLRNLLVIPLYLCNAVILTGNSSITLQTGLPAENQLLGADAIRFSRAVPGRLTVWIYTAFGGTMLLTVFIVICVSSLVNTPKTSSFPMADFLMLTRAGTRGWRGGKDSTSFNHDDIFTSVKEFGDNNEVLRCAGDVNLYPKQNGFMGI